jgi:hypothetical protein
VVSVEHTRYSKEEGPVGKVRLCPPTFVRAGKNSGKTNATNPVAQAFRDALGLYTKRAKSSALAAGGCAQPPPMLAQSFSDAEAAAFEQLFAGGVTVQRKFNGVRVVAFLRDDEVVLYSRTSKDYPGLRAVRQSLAALLRGAPGVPDGVLGRGDAPPDRLRAVYSEASVYLDGELYLHGRPLPWIVGQARRAEDEDLLTFVCFDCFFPEAKAAGHDMPSADRQRYLDLLFACSFPPVLRAENFPAKGVGGVLALRDRFVAEGYEGAVARLDSAGYRYGLNGYHSNHLVKFKPLFDEEFAVVGYTEGSRGSGVGAVVWICEVGADHAKDPADRTFKVVPKNLTLAQRRAIFRCLGEKVANPAAGPAWVTRFERDLRGKPLSVEFPERSVKTGKPVQAKALAFRTYEGGPEHDPWRRLLVDCGAL